MENISEKLRKKSSKMLGMKKIISNILAVVCICSLISYCFFRFGSKEIDELKEYISHIEQELNSLQEKDVLLQNDILALQAELDILKEKEASMQSEILELQTKLERIIQMLKTPTLLDIATCYEAGLLTKDDIMHVSYYKYGVVYSGDPWGETDLVEIDFTPKAECPNLNVEVETDIKKTFYEKYKEKFFYKDGTKLGDENDLFVDFYGCYNGSYIVQITSNLWSNPATTSFITFDGIVLAYNVGREFLVFRYE